MESLFHIITPPHTTRVARELVFNKIGNSAHIVRNIPCALSSENQEKLMSPITCEQGSSAAAEALAALKRPLSAYNIYFQLERNRIINGDPERSYTRNDAIALCDEQRILRSQPKPKRLHRKTHGVVTFQQMARTIADSWKVLNNGQRQLFEDCAASEKKRYLKEKHILKMQVAAEDAAAIEMIPSEVPSDSTPISEEEEAAENRRSHAVHITPENSHSTLNSNGNTFNFVGQEDQQQDVSSYDYLQRMMINNEHHLDFEGEQEREVEQADGDDDGFDESFYHTHQNLLYKLMLVHEHQAKLQRMERSIRFMIQQQRRMVLNKRKSLDHIGSYDVASKRPRNLNRRHSMSTFPSLQMMGNTKSSSYNTGGAYNLFNNRRSLSSINFASRFFDTDASENTGTDHLNELAGMMGDVNNDLFDLEDDNLF